MLVPRLKRRRPAMVGRYRAFYIRQQFPEPFGPLSPCVHYPFSWCAERSRGTFSKACPAALARVLACPEASVTPWGRPPKRGVSYFFSCAHSFTPPPICIIFYSRAVRHLFLFLSALGEPLLLHLAVKCLPAATAVQAAAAETPSAAMRRATPKVSRLTI